MRARKTIAGAAVSPPEVVALRGRRLPNRRVLLGRTSAGWFLLFKRLGVPPQEKRVHETRLHLSDDAMAMLVALYHEQQSERVLAFDLTAGKTWTARVADVSDEPQPSLG